MREQTRRFCSRGTLCPVLWAWGFGVSLLFPPNLTFFVLFSVRRGNSNAFFGLEQILTCSLELSWAEGEKSEEKKQ